MSAGPRGGDIPVSETAKNCQGISTATELVASSAKGIGKQGTLCYRLPIPPSAKCNGNGNYDNGDARSLAELGKDYNGLIGAIEEELCAVEGLEGLQSQARKGRSKGARFCWKPAMGDDTTGAAKSTSVSRAWRRTAKWLGDVLNTKRETNAETNRWKIRFYRHPRPDPARASGEQVMSFKVFEDWRGSIGASQPHARP